jgi:lipoprotein-anchoring transpeptidase ErfK/SrfK
VTKHEPSHRLARRRAKVSGLGLAVAMTVAVGGAAIGVLPQGQPDRAAASSAPQQSLVTAQLAALPTTTPTADAVDADVEVHEEVPAVPVGSGTGRRIVFDQSDQRVWLIEDDEAVARTYPVSGSRFDNLQPGSYTVQSKQEHATAFDASGTMDYFVRFATGYSEPIGFHSVPRDNSGKLEQTKAQLGTPLSAGCVRQWRDDAIALWDFAPVGTKVTVTA